MASKEDADPVTSWYPSRELRLQFVEDIIKEMYGKEVALENIAFEEERRGNEISPYLPAVQELSDMIDTDARTYMYFNEMFTQVPPEYKMRVHNYKVLLRAINFILTMPPKFTKHHTGVPINAILTWPMGTVAGYAAFMDDRINKILRRILVAWKVFLQSEESCFWLNEVPEYGWFSEDAMAKSKNFVHQYKCDPSEKYWGFKSWDDYFTREFRPHIHTILPENQPNNIIVNACESAPYRMQENVKARDEFWVKGQWYSIVFMMNNDPLHKEFIGGTVYQGFLSNLSYHRWHSPVKGTIVKAYLVDNGCYYAEARSMGFDAEGDNQSQAYLTEVQTRALIWIQAENTTIGLMCFMAVGMGDVSSCEITVFEGQKVEKGQQTGMFHLGGSTHCLLFRKDVPVQFDFHGEEPSLSAKKNIPLRARIASVPECT